MTTTITSVTTTTSSSHSSSLISSHIDDNSWLVVMKFLHYHQLFVCISLNRRFKKSVESEGKRNLRGILLIKEPSLPLCEIFFRNVIKAHTLASVEDLPIPKVQVDSGIITKTLPPLYLRSLAKQNNDYVLSLLIKIHKLQIKIRNVDEEYPHLTITRSTRKKIKLCEKAGISFSDFNAECIGIFKQLFQFVRPFPDNVSSYQSFTSLMKFDNLKKFIIESIPKPS